MKKLQLLPMDKLQQLAAKAATAADGQEENTPEPSNDNVSLQQPRPLEEAVPVQHNTPRPGANNASASRPPSLVEFMPPQGNNPGPNVHSTSSPRLLASREAVPAQPDKVADSVEHPEHDDQQTTPEQDVASEPVPSESGQEDTFYEDLETYKQETGSTIQPRPRIAGKSVELWDLLQTVVQYDIECQGAPDGGEPVGDTAANWDKVAVDLGYDLTEAAGVNDKLRHYYIQKVLPFLDWDYARNGEDEDEEDEEDAQQGDHTEPDVAEENAASPHISRSSSPRSYMPSSPPINGFKRKRSPSTFPPYSSGHGPKRRRLSPNAEIPATPEPETSPARDALASDHRNSKVRRNLHLNDHVPGSEASQQLPPLPDPQEEQSVEPETQDFEVAVYQQLHRVTRQESSMDVTPSQQLQSEDYDCTAIPIDLDRGRRHQDTSSSEPPSVQRPPSARTTATTNLLFASRGTAPPVAAQPASTASRNTTPVVKAKMRPLPTGWRQEPSPRPAATVRSPRSSPPRSDGSPNRPRTGNTNLDLISQWVEHYESLGYTNETVVEALKSTTMTPGGLAGIVMESLKHGKGIPAHYEGVWTPRDDKSLRVIMAARRGDAAADTDEAQIHQRDMAAKALKRLKNKHGEEGIELRQKFLAAQPGSESRLYRE